MSTGEVKVQRRLDLEALRSNTIASARNGFADPLNIGSRIAEIMHDKFYGNATNAELMARSVMTAAEASANQVDRTGVAARDTFQRLRSA